MQKLYYSPRVFSKWLQKAQWTVGLQCRAPSQKRGEGRDQSLFCKDTNFVQSLSFYQKLIKLDLKFVCLLFFFSCSFPLCPKILSLQLSSTTEPKIWATSSRKQSWRRKEASTQVSCDSSRHRNTTRSSEEYTNGFCKRFACILLLEEAVSCLIFTHSCLHANIKQFLKRFYSCTWI